MKNDDVILAICGPKRDGENATIGIEAFCTKCDTTVWLSDTTLKSLRNQFPKIDFEKNPPVILCIPCGTKQISNESKIIDISEIQKEEIKNILNNDRQG